MANKIIKCLMPEVDGVVIPTPEDGRIITPPIFIRPDQDGIMWYWDGPEETA